MVTGLTISRIPQVKAMMETKSTLVYIFSWQMFEKLNTLKPWQTEYIFMCFWMTANTMFPLG